MIENKKEHRKKFGISIQKEEWDCNRLPGTLVTDMGNKYVSATFGQIVELGITIISLPLIP